VSFIIKKEESPIVVPLLVSEDEETKSEERSPLPSLCYPTSSSSSSRASSRLSSYRTRSPALRYSPVRRGDSIYYPATPERSPTPLEHPIDWDLGYHHGAPTPPSSPPPQVLGRVSILSITLYAEYTYHQRSQTLFERDYSWAFSREQRKNATNRSGRGSLRSEQESKRDSIVKRELHPAIHLFLTLYLAVGSEALPLALFYVTVSLLFGLENLLGYLHVTVRITLATETTNYSLRALEFK
jgi:hypothetical protein